MIAEIISPRTTMEQNRDEREVYPDVQTYIDQAVKNLVPLMRATETKPKSGYSFRRDWMPPQPRPKLSDNHQLVLMIESALHRALTKEGFKELQILPAGEQFGFSIYWT